MFWKNLSRKIQNDSSLQKWMPIYEMVDTFVFWTNKVTYSAPHIRDALDMKRVMSYVVLAVMPCVFMSWFNTGYQINLGMAAMGMESLDSWRGDLTLAVGLSHSPNSVLDSLWLGSLYFFPIYVVTILAGGLWEVLFAFIRKEEVNEGFLVTSILYTLTLPPDTPLWMVALGISFGIVIGKEVFGGTGKNFLNPALAARAFLYFSYPAEMSGNKVWVALDGYSRATPLGISALEGIDSVVASGYTWLQSFIGLIPGSLGETSTIACLIGGVFLVWTRIASWRIIVGVMLGMVATSSLLNWIGSDTNPMFAMPWYWHLTLGGFAFGMIYMATEPVSATGTNAGRWVYGALIGFMAVIIRVLNPAFPEGMMLAILFANIFAPLIDYCVTQVHINKRMKAMGVKNEPQEASDG
ncbi:MAG: NADH:ubiquinone reductase (Na(+)-transporting) subunit B [Candidatus Oxydemutatoraceae bacterium WSBS_2016_MAG_OTU14]